MKIGMNLLDVADKPKIRRKMEKMCTLEFKSIRQSCIIKTTYRPVNQ